MPALSSAQVLFAVSTVALGLYAVLKEGKSQLIDTPEGVGRRVEPTEKDGQEQDDPEYDVVVIGGGTAGCVIASRLSENPDVRVLLLEAGGSSRNRDDSRIPGAFTQSMHTTGDYNMWTEPQANACGAKKFWPRGRMLGGCSSVNAMMFHTGAPSDYDEWAQSGQDGAAAWAHKNFLQYFLKFEKFVPHPDYPDVDPSVRGANGPVRVGFFGHLTATSAKWIQAHVNLGIPLNPDVNTPIGTLGVTRVLTYIDATGKRVNTETSYLTPAVLRRPNLRVAIHAHVTRILFENEGARKRAVGVEFAGGRPGAGGDGPRYRVRARREVVLAAGAVHSPHILLLSGIGPKAHLSAHGIPVVHDLPGVGQRLQDHAVVTTLWRVKDGQSLSYLKATRGLDKLWAFAALVRWKLFGSGPLTTNAGEAAAFVRLDDEKLFPPDGYEIQDETSGPDAPDLETIIIPLGFTQHGHGPVPSGSTITIMAVLLRPQSSGTITLRSADPFDAPLIDPRYLTSPNDMASLVRGLKLTARIAHTEPLASVLSPSPSPSVDADPGLDHTLHLLPRAALEEQVRKRIETLYHPASTCRMAPLHEGGVVDPYLRVYGVEGLRVADAAIFPRLTSGHTSAPVIAVGEKAADMIKEGLAGEVR